MKAFAEAVKETPVLYDVDVAVIGGGAAGIGAALAAGRNGAKTVLVERYSNLGGTQTLTYNNSFSFVDDRIQGGLIKEIWEDLIKAGATYQSTEGQGRARWTEKEGCFFFDYEYYKTYLDRKMAESGVTVLYHTYAVGGFSEGASLKGVLVESIEGRFAILAKSVIDCTGLAELAWKAGADVVGEEGFGDNRYGNYKGSHFGYGYGSYLVGLNYEKFREFAKANPEQWNSWVKGTDLIAKCKADGSLYYEKNGMVNNEYEDGRVWLLGPGHGIGKGEQPYAPHLLSAACMDLRKQAWSIRDMMQKHVPGCEGIEVEQTPPRLFMRDVHRLAGEYELTEHDMYNSREFEDSVVCSNMPPDIFFPDGKHHSRAFDVAPYDVPYRSLISKSFDNLLAAGSSGSYDIMVWCALRYCTPSVCTGQAAGTAAALAGKMGVTPKKLDVTVLQNELKKSGLITSTRDVPRNVMEEYCEKGVAFRGAYKLNQVRCCQFERCKH